MQLHNKYGKEDLLKRLKEEGLKRVTLSIYKYFPIENPQAFRDELYRVWDALKVLGRIYIANEGINGQLSVPEMYFDVFKHHLYSYAYLKNLRLNVAVEQNDESFLKLAVKVRGKILADGLDDNTFNAWDAGVHLPADKFNAMVDDPNTLMVDMRNFYESEIGYFPNAIRPDVETFRESLPIINDILKGNEDKNIVMYCTGGIRCEKASAWFKHQGFPNVFQLNGGIIDYANQCKAMGIPNRFIGKNFVFDERLGERISEDIVSKCHQCGTTCDTHVNCANVGCNLLFLQCSACAQKHAGCCSTDCETIMQLPEEERRQQRKQRQSLRRYNKVDN